MGLLMSDESCFRCRAPVTPPTLPRDPQTGLLVGRKPFTLRIIPGGKIGSKRPAGWCVTRRPRRRAGW